MKKLLAVVAVCCGIVWIGSLYRAHAEEPKFPGKLSEFMQLKLKHSQQALEGVVTEDYDRIATSAEQLSLLSRASNWEVLQTEEYLQQSREFRRAADALTAAAKKKNADGAALAYLDMTMKCVNCHKYVRNRPIAASDVPKKGS